MAIQVRRGNYADLDTSKLVQGEPFVTLDTAPDGAYYVGMTIAPNNVVRLATHDDLLDIKTACEDARDDAQASAVQANDSALDSEAWAVGKRNGSPVSSGDETYQNNSKYYAQQAGTYWGYIDNAVQLVSPTVTIDYTTGELSYTGSQLLFYIDQTTGELMWNVVHA